VVLTEIFSPTTKVLPRRSPLQHCYIFICTSFWSVKQTRPASRHLFLSQCFQGLEVMRLSYNLSEGTDKKQRKLHSEIESETSRKHDKHYITTIDWKRTRGNKRAEKKILQVSVRFEVLTAVKMSVLLFLVMTPCRLGVKPWSLHGVTIQKNNIVIYKTAARLKIARGMQHRDIFMIITDYVRAD
jgi:hypothetical protein